MDFLAWLSGLPPAVALRQSATLYILVNAGHILSIGLLVGAILPLDLRLAGILRSAPLSVLAPFLTRVAATGLALTIITGLCLFSVKPAEYIGNPAFLTKIGLLAFGALNVAVQHGSTAWHAALADRPVPVRVRVLAVLSFCTWVGAVIAGRWIGFV